MNKLLAFLAITLLLSACNKGLLPSLGTSSTLSVQALQFDYLSTKSKIRYSDADMSLNAVATIRMKRDSLIWVSVSPGLGIEAARALITKDSLFVINRLEKEFMTYSFAELSRMFQMDINFALVQNVLVGNLPLVFTGDEKVSKEGDHFQVKQQMGDFQVSNAIGRQSMKLEQLHVQDATGLNSLDVQYKDFRRLKEEAFPFQTLISLLYSSGGQSATTTIQIEHSKAELDEASLTFPFSIPGRYDRR